MLTTLSASETKCHLGSLHTFSHLSNFITLRPWIPAWSNANASVAGFCGVRWIINFWKVKLFIIWFSLHLQHISNCLLHWTTIDLSHPNYWYSSTFKYCGFFLWPHINLCYEVYLYVSLCMFLWRWTLDIVPQMSQFVAKTMLNWFCVRPWKMKHWCHRM